MKKTLFIATAMATVMVAAAWAVDTIKLVPFLGYYGEGQIYVRGAKMDAPVPVPNHFGDSSTDVEPGIQKLCGPTSKYTYISIGQSGGGAHGYNVLAGVCAKFS